MSVLRNALRFATIALFAAALASCGGGGGSGKGSSPVTPSTPPPPPPPPPPLPPPPPSFPTADPASGFTFDFRLYYQEFPANTLPKIYTKVVSGDFNGDGRDDLATVLQLNELRIFLQRQDGLQAEPLVFEQPMVYSNWQLLMVEDFNNDGADDIVFDTTDDFGQHFVNVLLSSPGVGSELVMRDVPQVRDYVMSGSGPTAFLAFDFDRDGNADLVELHGWKSNEADASNCVPNETCPHIVVFRGDGHGSFGDRQEFQWSNVPRQNLGDFFFEDVDSDGLNDVVFSRVFGYPEQRQLFYSALLPEGGLSDPKMLIDLAGDSSPPFFGDLNGDGLRDLLHGNAIHLRNADGSFRAPVGLQLYSFMESYWSILADFNGDGKTDLVNHQFEKFGYVPYFVTYLQRDSQLQAPFFRYDPPTSSFVSPAKWDRQAFAVGDFNGDGCRDIAVAAQYSGLLFLEGRNCIHAGP